MPTHTSIKVFVPGLPIAQPRQRHTKDGRNYTPSQHPVQGFKAAVAYAVRQEYQGRLWDGPIALEANIWFPRPKAKQWKSRPMLPYRHIIKPDADNVLKAIKDALKLVLWFDDAQVCDIHITKHVCGADEQPGVWLTITHLQEEV